METRQLGTSDLQLTTIGLGTWALGGGSWRFGWGPQDPGAAVAAIHFALDQGVNWIDTAPVYGNGQAEHLVGQALAESTSSDRPRIATKCGRIIEPDGSVVGRLTRESVIAECEASLRRLGTDTIDLYQIHWPDPQDSIEQAWEAIDQLRQQGKVRWAGVSNHQINHLERLSKLHPVTSLQPPYSLIARDAERELLPYCNEHRLGVIVYSPLGKGLLTGGFSEQRVSQLHPSDHRRRDPRFQPPQLAMHLHLVDGLQQLAAEHQRSIAELAIAWVLRRREVTAAIVGARSPQQLQTTLGAHSWRLPPETLARIDEWLDEYDRQLESLGSRRQARV